MRIDVDDECILNDSDYVWIKRNHPTAVGFSFSQAFDVAKIEAALKAGLFTTDRTPPMPPQTLAKIRKIAKTAKHLSEDLKKLL